MTRSPKGRGRRKFLRNPDRDPKQTMVATRIVTGSVTDENIKPRGRPAHAAKREKTNGEETEAPANVSTVSRTARRPS